MIAEWPHDCIQAERVYLEIIRHKRWAPFFLIHPVVHGGQGFKINVDVSHMLMFLIKE